MDAIPAPDEPSNPITELDQTLLVGEKNAPDANEIISNRLTRLAHLSTLHEYQTHPTTLDSRTVKQCLDTLESLLDPHSNLTREIALCRPPQPRPRSAVNYSKPPRKLEGPRTPPISPSSAHSRSRSLGAVSASRPARMRHDLAAVNDQVKMLGEAFVKRREETLYIYSLYDSERMRLRRRIAELEAEIEELRADMQEDLAEREALQGTVRGLEAWVEGMQGEYQLALQEKSTEASGYGGRGWWKKKVNKPGGFDADTLFEGITAWMRGWTDVEEEFRNRDKARRFRRENKHQSQHRAPPDID